tara:strand:+ start:2561 stop:4507 length:1947 start_codon:yes stop_codon:yes gene_type:complete
MFFLFFVGSISIVAQTTHQVVVANMSYTPSDLTIEVGDQVTFILEGGMHDVNFNISVLSGEPFDNPAEIMSLPMQSDPGEMGTITFDVPGTYNYDCSNYGHASSGMVGSITVNPAQVSSENALSLQGILDLDVPSGGSDGKAIHLVAIADISDLSEFGIGVANNGGGTAGVEYTLDNVSAMSGDNILIARSVEAMSVYFADCYSEFDIIMIANAQISQNGDDAIELYEGEIVIEIFGDINTDGTGEPWEYADSWAYKLDGEWTYGGVNCSDGSQTTLSSNCIYPVCDTGGDISGCMDETAFNYNPNATIDDGSCEVVMEGCMDDGALNYDADANTSCSSCCEYSGCTDSTAFNYDADATTDDGSCIYDTGSLTNALMLQGVMDFTVPSGGSDGKAIHLVATEDIADLSVFGLGVANNGGGTDGMEYSLDAVSAMSGDDIFIVRSVEAMSTYFADCYSEFEIIMVANSNVSQNGDDAVELYEQGIVIETFGDVDVDGTDEAWEYMDSWAYKVGDSWTYGGVNCTDDSQTSATSDCPYPICSDTPIDILGCMDSEACNYNPSATQNDGSCLYPIELYLDCSGNCINDTDMDGECDEVDYDDGLGMNELDSETPQVIKMIDVIGRVHTSHKSGMLLFYIYNNGKVQGVLKQ